MESDGKTYPNKRQIKSEDKHVFFQDNTPCSFSLFLCACAGYSAPGSHVRVRNAPSHLEPGAPVLNARPKLKWKQMTVSYYGKNTNWITDKLNIINKVQKPIRYLQ